jgi:hypothetical protein
LRYFEVAARVPGHFTGAMHSGESCFGSLTSRETAKAVICEAGKGLSSLPSLSGVALPGRARGDTPPA